MLVLDLESVFVLISCLVLGIGFRIALNQFAFFQIDGEKNGYLEMNLFAFVIVLSTVAGYSSGQLILSGVLILAAGMSVVNHKFGSTSIVHALILFALCGLCCSYQAPDDRLLDLGIQRSIR